MTKNLMPKNIVLDSSVAVKWLHKDTEKYVEKALKLLENLRDRKIVIYMPELAKYEVGNALLNKKMDRIQSIQSISGFFDIGIRFVPQDEKQAKNSMNIAQRYLITYYDASFLSLAESLNAPLITDNPKHQSKYKGKIKVIAIKDY